MKSTIQNFLGFCLGLLLILDVNSRTACAWVSPSTSVNIKSREIHRRRSSNPQYITSTSTAAASVAAAKMKLNGHNQNPVSPRKAVEVMSEGDLQQSDTPLEDATTTSAATEGMPSLTLMAQQQQQQPLDILQNHPIVQKILGSDDDELELSIQQKVINLLFLSAAFGYAIYTIINIDSGMTRGWTVQEQVMRIPLDNWGAYESYLANKPIITKTLINVIIYLLGDWLSQTTFQGKHPLNFDINRTMRNGFIGLCFGPCVHEYYQFSDAILPPENGLVTRLEKIFMDQTIYLTIKCSIYISAVGLLAGEDWPAVKQTVKEKIGGVVLTAWKFWPIVHCITYSVFEEMEEEDKQPSLSAIADPLLSFDATITETPGENDSVSIALVNDTAAPVVVDDLDVFGNQSGVFNTTSTKSTEAIAV
ncbi:MAG: hypothetical protein SGILL_000398 [Bacillariaceae sp.]